MNFTSIETRTSCMIQRFTLLLANVDDNFRQALNEKQKFVHFHGFIKYRDIFQSEADEPHHTKFSYLWAVGADVKGGIPKISDGRWVSEWTENPPGYNTET